MVYKPKLSDTHNVGIASRDKVNSKIMEGNRHGTIWRAKLTFLCGGTENIKKGLKSFEPLCEQKF
jgi:hypothetical protein